VANDDVEEPLIPSHLILGRRVITCNLPTHRQQDDEGFNISKDGLHRRLQYFHTVLDHFWKRWRQEYLLSLRDCHRYSKGNDVKRKLAVGDVVVLYEEGTRRGFWKLAKVETLIWGSDDQVRGAIIRIPSREGKTSILQQPVSHLYPLRLLPRVCQVVTKPPVVHSHQRL